MVTLLGLAFKGGPKNSSDLLLYLALAEHADEDGACYPSVERLAKWCRQDSRNTRRNMPKLANAGWVKVVKVGRRKEYVLDVPKLCLSALESGIKLSSEELSFLARKIPDKMSAMERSTTSSTPDKMSSIVTASAGVTPDKMSSIVTASAGVTPDKMSAMGQPIPDIHVIDTGHSRHPYREPLRTVIEPSGEPENETETPPSRLAIATEPKPETLAKAMLDRLAIISTDRILRLAAEAIRLQAGSLATTPHKAMLLIERQASLSQERGEPVNAFWFEDSKWKSGPSPAAVGVRKVPDCRICENRRMVVSETGGTRMALQCECVTGKKADEPEVESEKVPDGADREAGVPMWLRVREGLKKEISKGVFDTWIAPLRAEAVLRDVLYVRVPTSDFKFVGDRYEEIITKYLPPNMKVQMLSATGVSA